jgi:hypothetical protein
LAHGEADKIRAAYHLAEYINERRRMMRWWADHLDALRTAAGNVVALRRSGVRQSFCASRPWYATNA